MALDSSYYLHESDRAALEALQAIPGFSQVLKAFMKVWSEKVFRMQNMSSNLRLSEKQMAKYYNMLIPICDKLGIEVPELYIELNPVANAYTSGDTKPFITMTSGLLETIPEELIPTVLAHECGHIACHHVLYRTMGTIILSGAIGALGIGELATMPIQIALAYWMRCSEYSADRAAIICDGGPDKLIELCMRFAGYNKNIMEEASPELFMEQAIEYRQMVQDNSWNKSLEFLLFKNRSHPLNAVRAYEANEFSKRDRFALMVEYVNSKDERALEKLPVYLEVKKLYKNVDEVKQELISLGFNNIETQRVTDKNIRAREGNVITVIIDGQEITKDNWFNRDEEIVLVFYLPKSDAEEALDHPDEIRLPEGVRPFIGEHYEIAKAVFNRLGFKNVICEPVAMPRISWGCKSDMVAKVTIDGFETIERNSWFYPDATVVLYYYM